MTATPQMNNVEQTICTLSSVEQSRIGGLTIAELRSRFQKDSDIVSGPGKSSSGTTSSRGNMVRCSPDRVEKTRVSLSLSSSEARDFKEKIHKFDNFLQEQVSADSHALRTLPQKSGRLAASCDSSKIGSEAFNTDIGSSGNTMEEIVVAEKAVTDHKWKPVVPSKSPKRIQTGSSSHYKSPKPLPPPRDNPKNNLNDVDEHNSIYERRRRSPNLSPQFSIKPNPSHLSTLISEVQKQQQQLMSKKIGFSNSRQESGITDSDFKGQSSQSLECVSSTCPAPHELKQMSLNCGSSLELTTITYLSKLWKPKRLPSLKVLGLPPQKPTKPPKTLSTVIVVPPKIGATPPLPNRNPSMNSSGKYARSWNPC